MIIQIARDFSKFPAGRYYTDGPFSGQKFREEFLKGPLLAGEPVEIHLAGAKAYPSSFLEEAFGGLVRLGYVDQGRLKQLLRIVPDDASFEIYADLIDNYIHKAVFGEDKGKPQPTPAAADA